MRTKGPAGVCLTVRWGEHQVRGSDRGTAKELIQESSKGTLSLSYVISGFAGFGLVGRLKGQTGSFSLLLGGPISSNDWLYGSLR